ncbi:MAG: protein translocase subunit SecD [Acidimicrobiia bacterium]
MATRRGRRGLPLVFIVAVSLGLLVLALVRDWQPVLGLDLQGGVSVVLQPTEEANTAALSQSIEIIRDRVDALGVAEPEITRQGNAIVVQLPGVDNQQRALELVGDTAELRFRPVLSMIPGSIEDLVASTTTTTASTTSTTAADAATTTTEADATTSSVQGFRGQQDPSTTTTPAPDETTTTTTAEATTTTTTAPSTGFEVTPREDDVADQPVVLTETVDGEVRATYQLGPAMATGEIVETARAELLPTGEWVVALTVRGGSGIEQFNAAAASCYVGSAECPSRSLAIVLDSNVVSAPQIQQPSFSRDEIQISGAFRESEAKDLALVLRYGSLPIELEPQTVQTVSATLGEDSLRAGLVAGLVGLGLVFVYMLLYYRALGIVVVLGTAVWAALNWALVAWLGETQGLALSLSGVTGLVVSIGVTVDSYVVFFERIKDDVKLGRSLNPAAVDRAFARAFRTVLAANVTSFIGAFLLYWLTVGPVRGFAFFLGLATILDVAVTWFFTRPLVAMLAGNRLFTEARFVGVARGLARPDAAPVTATATGGAS